MFSVLAGRAFLGPSRSLSFPRLKALRRERLDLELQEKRRNQALLYARAFIGQPYRWGGDDPIHGFDCSGLVIEVLTAVGILPHRYDAPASTLLATLRALGAVTLDAVKPGAVIFFRNASGDTIHVELGLEAGLMLGASGGGSDTDDLEDAATRNAFVKVRPAGYRLEQATIVDPFACQGRKDTPMKIKTRAKAAVGDIAAIVAAIIGFLPGLLKKKPYTLWQWDPIRKTWIDHGTYSARSCRKLMAELVRLGQDPATFTIMRKGAKPPAEGPK